MMGFTDELVGLDIAHKREWRQLHSQAQALVDQKDTEILLLRRALQDARAEAARERGKRIAVQAQLDAILDMEI